MALSSTASVQQGNRGQQNPFPPASHQNPPQNLGEPEKDNQRNLWETSHEECRTDDFLYFRRHGQTFNELTPLG